VLNRRNIKRVIVFLLLGAIVNVAVAWAYAGWSRMFADRLENGPGMDQLGSSPYRGEDLSKTTTVIAWNGTGVVVRDQFAPFAQSVLFFRSVSSGWPMLSLTGEHINNRYDRWILRPPQCLCSKDRFSTSRFWPLRPIWPGFAINTIFYAAMLWMLIAAPRALRRKRRLKRGLCPACAYPIGSSDVCTECGAAVKPERGRLILSPSGKGSA